MNIIDEVIASYKIILTVVLFILAVQYIRIFAAKFTKENFCPNCKATDSERVPRNIFTKLLFFHKTVKQFKCLKCWKNYYVVSNKS